MDEFPDVANPVLAVGGFALLMLVVALMILLGA